MLNKPAHKNNNLILGIDPGTTVMGHALLQCNGSNLKLLSMDAIKLATVKNIYERLELIHNTIDGLIKQYHPNVFAIEAPFFGKNVQSMLKLGRAQGVAIAAAIANGLEVTEYAPKKIKQSITGNGNADKMQVWKMLKTILHLSDKPKFFDASDALAVALCHHYQLSSPLFKSSKNLKGWEDFIKANPNRLK